MSATPTALANFFRRPRRARIFRQFGDRKSPVAAPAGMCIKNPLARRTQTGRCSKRRPTPPPFIDLRVQPDMQRRITTFHRREFDVAPYAECGDIVSLERIDPKNTAWFFGSDVRGATGYFPVEWFEIDGLRAVARRNYDAAELTVSPNTVVEVQESYGRWLFVTTGSGESGWIPQECVD